MSLSIFNSIQIDEMLKHSFVLHEEVTDPFLSLHTVGVLGNSSYTTVFCVQYEKVIFVANFLAGILKT